VYLLQEKSKLLPILLFLFFLIIFSLTTGGHLDAGDGRRHFLYAENFVINGKPALSLDLPSANFLRFNTTERLIEQGEKTFKKNLETEEGKIWKNQKQEFVSEYFEKNQDEFYDQTPLVLPTFAAGLYSLSILLRTEPIWFVPFFSNSIIIALTSVIIFFIAKELFGSEKIGFVLSVIFGLTTFIWPYITSLWSRPLALLFLLLCFYFLIKQNKKKQITYPIIGGACLGLSVLSAPHFLIFFPGFLIFGLYRNRFDKKLLLGLLLAAIIMMGMVAYSNYDRFGSINDFGYQWKPSLTKVKQDLDDTEGLYGIIISPGKSIFLYFPVGLLFPLGFYFLYKKDKSLFLLFVYLSVLIYFYSATTHFWYTNSNNWGPHRYLIPLIPFWVLAIGFLIIRYQTIKIPIIILSIFGFFINFLGNLIWIKKIWAFGINVEGLNDIANSEGMWNLGLVFAWHPEYSPPIEILKIIFSEWDMGLGSYPWIESQLPNCKFDLYLYCNNEFTSIFLLIVNLGVILFLILHILNTKQIKSIED